MTVELSKSDDAKEAKQAFVEKTQTGIQGSMKLDGRIALITGAGLGLWCRHGQTLLRRGGPA